MNARQRFRISLDIIMLALSLTLMGGNYFFEQDAVHEICGVTLLALWATHVALNRRWYSSLLRGAYSEYRIMQAVINCAILMCAIFLITSAVMLSNHVFAFLNISTGATFARTAHLLSSHWYFFFMSMHIGLHADMIAGAISRNVAKRATVDSDDAHGENIKETKNGGRQIAGRRIAQKIFRAAHICVCVYGVYAFISRGVWRYLVLQQEFFFLDMEKGRALFYIDYIAIVVLFATIAHALARRLQRRGR